jgi:hypothetical protein
MINGGKGAHTTKSLAKQWYQSYSTTDATTTTSAAAATYSRPFPRQEPFHYPGQPGRGYRTIVALPESTLPEL